MCAVRSAWLHPAAILSVCCAWTTPLLAGWLAGRLGPQVDAEDDEDEEQEGQAGGQAEEEGAGGAKLRKARKKSGKDRKREVRGGGVRGCRCGCGCKWGGEMGSWVWAWGGGACNAGQMCDVRCRCCPAGRPHSVPAIAQACTPPAGAPQGIGKRRPSAHADASHLISRGLPGPNATHVLHMVERGYCT